MIKMTAEKAPPKRKIPKFTDLKKPLLIGGIITAIAVAGIVIGINIISKTTQPDVVLVFSYNVCPNSIDPLEFTRKSDAIVIDQVAEGLFEIDVKSNNSELIPNLATNHIWSDDSLNLTCTLRKGVKFHDGTPFNATAVQWNFERLYGLINNSGFAFPGFWFFPDDKPIINETQVLGEYTVRFVLNAPYVPLLGLLTFLSSSILSPTATPKDEFIDVRTGDLVGTGPFIYDSYGWQDNVSMSANPHYWGGKPKIDKLIYLQTGIANDVRIEALLSGNVHCMENVIINESLLNNPAFTVQEGIPQGVLSMVIMNNKLINVTMRKAISYAINYSFITKEWGKGGTKIAKGPIPEGILYYNTTGISVPYYNISKARQILKDVNWNNTAGALTADNNVSAGNEWEKLVDNGTPLAIYNYSLENSFPSNSLAAELIAKNLKQIGVRVEIINMTWMQWNHLIYNQRNMIELGFQAWLTDYNDPSTWINEFYTTKRIGNNWGQVNDTQLEHWMEDALKETDPIARRQLYYEIQKHLIEEVYPYAWFTNRDRRDVHVSNLRGYYPNTFKSLFKFAYFV